MRKAMAVITVAFVAAFAPAEFTPAANDGVVRLQGACAQATSCFKTTDYICSTYNADHVGYACYTGCARLEE